MEAAGRITDQDGGELQVRRQDWAAAVGCAEVAFEKHDVRAVTLEDGDDVHEVTDSTHA